MKTCLIVDTETTGLDPDESEAIEVGAILYSITHQTPLASLSFLCTPVSENPCEQTNRIPAAATEALPTKLRTSSWDLFNDLADHADVIVAHNADFDKQWYWDIEKPWLCTMEDFDWSPHDHVNGKSLVAIALSHGIGVSSAHRALTDCQLIAELLNRHHDLQTLFRRAMRPKAIFRAVVSYDDNHLAKAAGFRWNPESKIWWRRMAIEDAAKLSFRTVKIQDC